MKHKSNVQVFVDAGLPFEAAEIVADCFETADLYGVQTHGTAMIESHLERIRQGGYNLHPQMKIIKESPAFALIDGENGMGPVVADFCMRYATSKCKKVGVYTVFSRNNNTLGPAFYYPLKAAQQGVIGFVCTNAPAQMALIGGKEKMLGTNPFSAVIPVPGHDPLIIDMATSVVAKSKFNEYKNAGKPLPEGWALDKEGNPTTNPDKAIQGFVQPMSGYKGQAIAMLIDILSGVLSGAAFLNHVGRFYSPDKKCMNVGFYMTAIDPKIVFGNDYAEAISAFVSDLRNSEAIDGKTISLPGDDRLSYKNSRRADVSYDS